MNRPSEELLHKTLENRATAAEAASVAEWLATDSGQAWASRYIGRDFDRQESCGDYEREEVASERIFARIKTALTRSRRRRILFRVAAVVIPVALVLGVALRLDRQVGGIFSDAEYGEFVVDRGRRTQCLFQDGTVAHLNSESKIHYPVKFGLFERRIRLEGEAYFEVARNADLPFRVQARGCTFTVLGTRFNISAYDEDPDVLAALMEGSLQFESSRSTETMVPGDLITYDCRTMEASRRQVDTDQFRSWIDGIIRYDAISLPALLRRLAREYDVKIELCTDAFDDKTFRISLTEAQNIESIMGGLCDILPISVRRDTCGYRVDSRPRKTEP